MKKIKLPSCKFYEGACPKISKKPCNFTNNYECPHYEAFGGFDALAAAVRKAGLFYELKDPYPNKDADQCQVEMVTQPRFRGWRGVKIEGSTPTAALLAAINKCNEENND